MKVPITAAHNAHALLDPVFDERPTPVSQRLEPTATALEEKAEQIRRRELRKAIRVLGSSVAPEAESVVDSISSAIVSRLLTRPATMASLNNRDAEIISRLFKIDSP